MNPTTRWLNAIIFGVALGSGSALAQAPAEDVAALGSTLRPLLELLERRSPEIRATEFEAQAARERPDAAGALPDPMLTFEEMGISAPTGMERTRFALRQTFPLGGKRTLAREIAEAGVAQAEARATLSRVELRSLVKLAFNEYQYAHAAIGATQSLLDLVDELERIAETRYRVGLAPQQDVIQAQAERTRLQSELLTLERIRRGAAANLNGILARSANAPLAEPAGWPLLPERLPSLVELQQRIESNPKLAEIDARIVEAGHMYELARRNWIPDLTVGTGVVRMGDQAEEYEVMVEINLPLWGNRRSAARREAVSLRDAAEARREAATSRLIGDLGVAWSALQIASDQHELIEKTFLPQANLTYQSALASYQTGKVDFATVLGAQRQIRELRLALLSLTLEQRVQVVELERLVGAEL